MPNTVVVIHGVGNPALAEVGTAVANNLGFNRARRATIYSKGQAFLEIVNEVTGDSVIEVNWADLLRPKASVIGIFRHLCYIITSMLDVAAREKGGRRPIFIRLYQCMLFTVTPGAVLFTLATAVAISFDTPWQRSFLLLLLILASVFIFVWLQKLGVYFRPIWLWLGPLAALWCAATFMHPDVGTKFVELSKLARAIGFMGVVGILALSVVECWIRSQGHCVETKLTYLALLYFPFIAMNSLMTWLGFITLSVIKSISPKYDHWEGLIIKQGNAQALAQIEVAATLVIGGIGILAVILPSLGYVFKSGIKPPKINQKGRGAQDGMVGVLALAPIALILLAAYCIWVFQSSRGFFNISPDTNILSIYRTSIWRTLPYLAWFVGPFAIVSDVIGDVLFYLQPNKKHPAAIAKQCKERLSAALDYIVETKDQISKRRVIVLAHSQGSVIASALREEGALTMPLLTAGSPIGSLYRRFLGVNMKVDQGNAATAWVNCFRDGDVIAGPIEDRGVVNEHIGEGGHTDYWSDTKIREILSTMFESKCES